MCFGAAPCVAWKCAFEYIYIVYTTPWIVFLARADWLARWWFYIYIHLRASSDARNSKNVKVKVKVTDKVTDKVVFGAIFRNLCSIQLFQKQDKYRRKVELLRDTCPATFAPPDTK